MKAMTIKERKIILHFLKEYLEVITSKTEPEQSPFFQDFFSREELLSIIQKYYEEDENKFLTQENEELETMILDELVLQYYIEKIESGITATPTLSKKEVNELFDQWDMQSHYLYEKPVDQWDDYDRSNYYAMLFKHGKTKRVFAIYTSDVKDEDKYVVTTQPSFFFDTEEEAEEELERIIEKQKFKRDELKIMSLWQIT